MSEKEPDGPYVYQPYGALDRFSWHPPGRLWGVSGVHLATTIKGLTREEAEAIVRTLKELQNGMSTEEQDTYERGIKKGLEIKNADIRVFIADLSGQMRKGARDESIPDDVVTGWNMALDALEKRAFGGNVSK